MAEVSLTNVSKAFGKTQAVKDISMTVGAVRAVRGLSLTVPRGAIYGFIGPNGSGKTTTLRLISGLEKLDAGTIHIGGRDVGLDTPAQRDVAMVFQQYSLYPHLTVRDNLAFPLRSPILKTPEDVITRKVQEIADILQIPHKLDNKATELSGGEMQRVSIGRALVRDPQVFLMDEPLSSLDAKLRADLRVELKRIQADLGATLLYVTHDQIEAMTMATHVGVLSNTAHQRKFMKIRKVFMSQAALACRASTSCRPICSPAHTRRPRSASVPRISGRATGSTQPGCVQNIWATRPGCT